MKTLVLGSRGQVGAPLVEYLESAGHEVVGRDMELDLRYPSNIVLLAKDIAEADFVFFLAFDVGGSTYLSKHQSSLQFLQNNTQIIENFARAYNYAGAKYSKHNTPFIFASSQMSNMSWSQYGVLKRLGEFYTTALGGVNIRFWNVYGYEEDLEKYHVVSDFILDALNGGPISMRTDGVEKRQMLHAADASRAMEALMLNYDDLDKSEYYDITSFEWIQIIEIAEIVSKLFGVDYVKGASPDNVQKDFGNEPTDAIKKYWEPYISLEGGIKMVAEKMKEER